MWMILYIYIIRAGFADVNGVDLFFSSLNFTGLLGSSHFLWNQELQFLQKITFLFTDPKHFLHGFWMGPGFKLTSPDSSNKYLKNESWFLSFSLESTYNDRFLSSIGILSQKEKNSYEKSSFVPIGCERSLKVGLWFFGNLYDAKTQKQTRIFGSVSNILLSFRDFRVLRKICLYLTSR